MSIIDETEAPKAATGKTVKLDNRPRVINLDDTGDEMEEQGDVVGLDQDVDFEAIKGPQVCPRGEYYLINEGVEVALSKTSQQLMFKIRARIQGGEFDGVPHFQDYSWSEKARARTKKAFVGMGLDPNYKGTLRSMAEALKDLEYYAIFDIEQSEGVNPKTNEPFDPRNRIVSTSETPQA